MKQNLERRRLAAVRMGSIVAALCVISSTSFGQERALGFVGSLKGVRSFQSSTLPNDESRERCARLEFENGTDEVCRQQTWPLGGGLINVNDRSLCVTSKSPTRGTPSICTGSFEDAQQRFSQAAQTPSLILTGLVDSDVERVQVKSGIARITFADTGSPNREVTVIERGGISRVVEGVCRDAVQMPGTRVLVVECSFEDGYVSTPQSVDVSVTTLNAVDFEAPGLVDSNHTLIIARRERTMWGVIAPGPVRYELKSTRLNWSLTGGQFVVRKLPRERGATGGFDEVAANVGSWCIAAGNWSRCEARSSARNSYFGSASGRFRVSHASR